MDKGKFLYMGVLSIAILAVAGCEDGAGFGRKKASGPEVTSALDRPASAKLVERDVEAPEVFSKNEPGLWDGRPSLGGVWVAHPDVKEPERVIIRNEANGKFVIGALFKRERENPGPRIQVSSDAANSLGILPGAPTKLSVVALVREEVPETVAPASQMASASGSLSAPAAIEQKSLDAPLAAAEAAIAKAEVNGGTATGAAQEEAPEKAKKGFWSRMKNKKNRRQAADNVISASSDTAPASSSSTQQIATSAVAAPVQVAAAVPAPRAAAPKSSGKNFLQIGIFSVQDNANRTADNMRKAGAVPTVYEQQSAGKTFWRVVVGPAQAPADRQALLKKVKALGFQDAYFVRN